jgi:DNA-binding response OmpR family regulator
MTRVLVIEDDLSVGTAILMILDGEGCHAVHAADADTGKRAFESYRFDLVIVDIFMPGMSGLKIIAELRKQAPTVPILAMSGFRFRGSMNSSLNFLGMAAEAGATACLRKPFAPRQLITAVSASLDPVHPVLAPEKSASWQGGRHNDAVRFSL